MADDRFDDLAKDISAAQEKHKPPRDKDVSGDAHAGIEFAVSIILPPLAGYGLDSYFGTAPALFLVLLVLGICTGFYSVYRLTLPPPKPPDTEVLHQAEKDVKKPANLDF